MKGVYLVAGVHAITVSAYLMRRLNRQKNQMGENELLNTVITSKLVSNARIDTATALKVSRVTTKRKLSVCATWNAY